MATFRSLARVVPRAISSTRPYHTTTSLRLPYKDSQDRESLKPRAQESTRSGSDDDVAANTDAAFNPDKTRPEQSAAETADGQLNASGANQEFNKPQGDEKSTKGTGAGRETEKGGTSRGGGAPKKGDPKTGGGQ